MKEIRQKTIGYILAGFGFVAGLAWNDAVKSLIDYVFPLPGDVLVFKLVYAFVITLLVVLAGTYLLRLSENGKK